MAYISQQQLKDILLNAPKGSDTTQLVMELGKQNTIQGYNETPTPQQSPALMENPEEKKGNFLTRAVKSFTAPVVKAAGSGIRAIQATPDVVRSAFGDAEAGRRADETMAKPLFGQKTLSGSSNMENLGSAGQAVSYITPAKFISGAISGAGDILAEGGNFKEAGITGVATGVLNKYGGKVLGKVFDKLPAGVKSSAANVTEKAGQVLSKVTSPITGALEKYIQKPIVNKVASKLEESVVNDNRQILNLPAKLLNKEAKYGKDTAQLLVDEGINLAEHVQNGQLSPDVPIGKILESAKAEDTLLSAYLRTEAKLTQPQDIIKLALGELKGKGIDRDNAASYLTQQFEALVRQTPGALVENNGTTYGITMEALNDIKGSSWSNVANFLDQNAAVKNDANFALGRAIKNYIEKEVPDININGFNKRLGDLYGAVEALVERRGKKVAGRGLTPLINKGVGAVAGSTIGGPGGAIAGGIIAQKVSATMTDNAIPAQIKFAFLQKLQSTPEGSQILADVEKKLGVRLADLLDRQMNPARQLGPGAIPMGGRPDASGSFFDQTPTVNQINNTPLLPSGKTNGIPNILPMNGRPDPSYIDIQTGSVPRPDIAKGAGMYVKPRKDLKVTDIPKIKRVK